MRVATRLAVQRVAAQHRVAAQQHARSLAILPQLPVMGSGFLKKEKKLRAEAERAVIAQERARREAVKTPQFSKLDRPRLVLKAYEEKRNQLTPRDAAAAFFALGRLNRNSAYKKGYDPLWKHPTAVELRADVAASAPYLPSRDLSNALLAAAYSRTSDEVMLSALCSAAAEKAAEQFSLRDVASTVYALGRLKRRDTSLLPPLLSRVSNEAPLLHAIEMSLTASGLADLELAPPTALGAISRAAIPKLDQFGAEELPKLLAALSALGWHDELLLRLSCERLPLLLTDMEPKAISATAAVLASSDLWIPPALESLAAEAELKAEAFSCRHAAVALAALGRLRWHHNGAIHALARRVVVTAERNQAELCDLAITVRVLSREAADQSGASDWRVTSGAEEPKAKAGAEATTDRQKPEDMVPALLEAATRLLCPDGPSLPPPQSAQRRHAGGSGFAAPSMPSLPAPEQPQLQIASSSSSEGGGAALTAGGASPPAVVANAPPPAHRPDSSEAPKQKRSQEEVLVERRDLAMLCNGAVQLGVTPPAPLVQYVREVVNEMEGEKEDKGASSGSSEQAASSRKEVRAERRVRAKLSDALRRWEGMVGEVSRRDEIEQWIESLSNPTSNRGRSRRKQERGTWRGKS